MGLGSIAGAAFGIGGGIASALTSAKATEKATQMQIDWERERAKNSHQWEVQDLKSAGLNPILSAGGNGATTGGISAPVPDTSGYAQAGQAISSALQLNNDTQRLENEKQQLQATLEEIRANVGLKNSQKNLIDQQKINEMVKEHLISAQTAHEMVRMGLTSAQKEQTEQETNFNQQRIELELASSQAKLEILQAQIEEAKANRDYAQANALIKQYEAEHRKFAYWNNQIGTAVKSVTGMGVSALAAGKGIQALRGTPPIGFIK